MKYINILIYASHLTYKTPHFEVVYIIKVLISNSNSLLYASVRGQLVKVPMGLYNITLRHPWFVQLGLRLHDGYRCPAHIDDNTPADLDD